MEMDSTTVVLPGHHGRVDALGNLLIYPDGYRVPKRNSAAADRSARPAISESRVKSRVTSRVTSHVKSSVKARSSRKSRNSR
jgi:hypothetical protein